MSMNGEPLRNTAGQALACPTCGHGLHTDSKLAKRAGRPPEHAACRSYREGGPYPDYPFRAGGAVS